MIDSAKEIHYLPTLPSNQLYLSSILRGWLAWLPCFAC
jgi:hypothetical protein